MSEIINLTRCCWDGSVGNLAIRHEGGKIIGLSGGLRSGRGAIGPRLSPGRLLRNFNRHRDLRSPQPFEWRDATALVSASDRILDTLTRSFHKYYVDGVPPENIHIVFIQISESQFSELPLHSALDLARQLQLDKPYRFQHEYLFEWAIPKECVVHSVTFKTLLNRGLSLEKFILPGQFPTTQQIGQAMAEDFFHDADPWEVGLQLGYFGRYFGAKAPTYWITKQLCWDMVDKVRYILDEPEYARIRYAVGKVIDLDDHYLAHMEDGIDTCLIHWWLLNEDFLLHIQKFEDWRDIHEENLIDSQNDWYLAWKGKHNYPHCEKARRKLERREMRLRASIESESVRVGL